MNLRGWWSVALLLIAPQIAIGGPCDAFFSLDGDLADSGSNGYDGEMVGKGGVAAQASFVAGKFGAALVLDGTGAMRAPIDLHFDGCPQLTISAWVRVDRSAADQTLQLLSTGGGGGPGMRISGSFLTLAGTESGIGQPDAISPGTWTFVAGVYDWAQNQYQLFWGNRHTDPQPLSASRTDPLPAVWLGTVSDDWNEFSSGVAIDNLRIEGRAYSAEQFAELLQSGALASSPERVVNIDYDREPDLLPGGIGDSGQSAAPSSYVGPTCAAQTDCSGGTYCAWDRMCHPENHAPMRELTAEIFQPAGTVATLPESEPATGGDAAPATGLPRAVGAGLETRVSGEESKTTRQLDLVNNFLVGIVWGETGDRPCSMSIDGESEAKGTATLFETLGGCDPGIGVFGDHSGGISLPEPPPNGDAVERSIRELTVCRNVTSGRLKGALVGGVWIDATGHKMMSAFEDEYSLLTNCNAWGEVAACDERRVATGVIIHYTRATGRNEQIVGLQLICRRIALQDE